MKKENFVLLGFILVFITIITFVFGECIWINPDISLPNKYFDTGMLMTLWLCVSIGAYGIIKNINL